MFCRFLTCLLLCLAPLAAPAQLTPTAKEAPTLPSEPVGQSLGTGDAIVLGLVEGITEFLPISSTGHLIIALNILELEDNTPLRDANGEVLWLEPPSAENPAGEPLTLKLAADTYIVVIQMGGIAAVIFVFWQQLLGILRGLVGRNSDGVRLLRNIILAFLPPAIVGLALDDWIDEHLFSMPTVIAALVVGAALMIWAERWRKQRTTMASVGKQPADLTPLEAVQIGGMQCLALWPGMSRSMVTMVGGYFAGLAPARAAEFSFLVGLPVLGGAAVYKGWKSGPAMMAVFDWPEMLLGAAVAAISAAVAVRFLVAYLSRYGLGLFAIYRVVLAIALAFWFWA